MDRIKFSAIREQKKVISRNKKKELQLLQSNFREPGRVLGRRDQPSEKR